VENLHFCNTNLEKPAPPRQKRKCAANAASAAKLFLPACAYTIRVLASLAPSVTKQERSLRSLPEPKESIKGTEITLTRILVIAQFISVLFILSLGSGSERSERSCLVCEGASEASARIAGQTLCERILCGLANARAYGLAFGVSPSEARANLSRKLSLSPV
jgi:hypothetical protein